MKGQGPPDKFKPPDEGSYTMLYLILIANPCLEVM